MLFCDLLNQAMAEAGVRAKDVCEHTGKSPSTVWKWVHGISSPGRFTLERLGEYLKGDPGYFLQAGITYPNGIVRL